MDGNSETPLISECAQRPELDLPLKGHETHDAADQAISSDIPRWIFPTFGVVRIADLTFQPYPDLGMSRRQKSITASPEVGVNSEECKRSSVEDFNTQLQTAVDAVDWSEVELPSQRPPRVPK